MRKKGNNKNVYVNARFLTQSLTGVQRYAVELSLRLKKMNPLIQFICPKNVIQHDLFRNLEARVIGNTTGHLWEQTELPIYLKTQKNPLLINLCSTAPICYKNKIVTVHDITYVRCPQSFSKRFRILYHVVIPLILNDSLECITVSRFSAREISGHFKNIRRKPFVVYSAVADQFQIDENKDRKNHPYLLAVSSYAYHKNFTKLIKAFDNLYQSGEINLPLVIAGGESVSSLSKQSYRFSSNTPVHLIGKVTDEELLKLYQGATAFVFPSLYEGFGLPPLEAQACGCPVVASNAAAMPEILGDSALYFSPNNILSMQEAICRIVNEPILRDSLKEKGLSNVSRFSWDISFRQLCNVLLKYS
jgi:glycosyltransferase involved in cell wall biosynthesis